MMNIGVLSDTHSFYDLKINQYFSQCDEIWHAGDIGDEHVLDQLESLNITKAVYGNIDSQAIRRRTKEHLFFNVEGKKVLLLHIAGKMGSYTPETRSLIELYKPDILVCGHSHILKVAFDKKFNLLYINPGAAGISGFHQIRTLLRFKINTTEISDMQVIELGARSPIDSL